MRAPSLISLALLALSAIVSPELAHAGWLADLEIYDRTARQTLPIYEHDGRLYVAGEPRHQYELRIRNRSQERVLAVTSVDGVNVISGETAAAQQSGYVLDRYDSVSVEGWRKSLDEVATFYFTRLPDSYAARTGRPQDVGVIGVALFREYARREYRPCCEPLSEDREEAAAAPTSPRAQEKSADSAARRDQAARDDASRLGTGHGHREASPAQYVDFRRATSTPDETLVIYYDSRRNLVAQGVLPPRARYADRRPNPFPNGFVPDP